MSTRFNTDTDALNTRADLNRSRARHDLEDWMLGLLPSLEGKRVVDLGCGSGKQIMRFAPLVGREGKVLGIDASEQAVSEVESKASAAGYDWVSAAQITLDDSAAYLESHEFDLVISSYAIYYATDFVQLLRDLGNLMGAGGQIFVCGPGEGTNRELLDVVARLAPDRPREEVYVRDFIDVQGISELAAHFGSLDIHRLDNAVTFHSPAEVMAWWKNHNSFVPELESQVGRQIEEDFQRISCWEMTKSVLGVHCRV